MTRERSNSDQDGRAHSSDNRGGTTVKTFRDLEIYRDAQGIAVELVRDLMPSLEKHGVPIADKIAQVALIIPTKISQSYGLRFQDRKAASDELFEVTQACNRLIVYLDQARDIYLDARGAKDRADRLLEATFALRVKVYNLKKSWAKWDAQDRRDSYNGGHGRYQSGQNRNSNYNGYQNGGGGYQRQNGGGYQNNRAQTRGNDQYSRHDDGGGSRDAA